MLEKIRGMLGGGDDASRPAWDAPFLIPGAEPFLREGEFYANDPQVTLVDAAPTDEEIASVEPTVASLSDSVSATIVLLRAHAREQLDKGKALLKQREDLTIEAARAMSEADIAIKRADALQAALES